MSDENAHVGREWTERDRAAAMADEAHWREAFARVDPCPRCAWPFAMACPCSCERRVT